MVIHVYLMSIFKEGNGVNESTGLGAEVMVFL